MEQGISSTDNIILVPKYFLPTTGGLQNFTLRLAKSLIAAKKLVFVLTPEPEPFRPWPIGNKPVIENLFVQTFSEPRDQFWQKLPARVLRGKSSSILAIGLEDHSILDSQLKSLVSLQKEGFPAFLRVATTFDLKSRINLIRAIQLRKIGGLVVLNEAMLAEAMTLPAKIPHVHKLPNPVDSHEFQPSPSSVRFEVRTKFGLPMTTPVILSAGRLDPRKRLELLIEATSLASSEAVLWIVGDPASSCDLYPSKLIALAKHFLPNRTVFTPGLPDHMMPIIYGAANIFALTSRVEGLSNATLEAASTGLAIVAVAIPGVTEIAQHFNNYGFFLVTETVESIATGLRKSLETSPSQSWRQSRETALGHFSPERIANQYIEMFSHKRISKNTI